MTERIQDIQTLIFKSVTLRHNTGTSFFMISVVAGE